MTIFIGTPTGTAADHAPVFGPPGVAVLDQTGTPGLIAVPNALGRSQDAAEELLSGFGFSTTAVHVPGPGAEGEVYGQQPRPDDVVARGTVVRLFVIAAVAVSTDVEQELASIDGRLASLTDVVVAMAEVAARAATEDAAADRQTQLVERLDALAAAVAAIPTTGPTGTTGTKSGTSSGTSSGPSSGTSSGTTKRA